MFLTLLFSLAVDPQPPAKSRAETLQGLRQDVKDTLLKSSAEILDAPAEKKKALREMVYGETLPGFVTKALEIIEQNPADGTAFDAIVWVMEQQGCWNTLDPKQHLHLIEQIETYHAERPDLMRAVYWLPWLQPGPDDKASGERKVQFVSRLLKESKHDAVKASACYTLAKWSFHEYERAMRAKKPDAKLVEVYAAKAEQYFVQLERDFAKLPYDPVEGRADLNEITRKIAELKTGQKQPEPKPLKPQTYGPIAHGYLIELRSLGIGKLPPTLEGIGLDGKPVNLSDYKGKVVVLVFWAKWCTFCMANVPAEVELVKRMADRPFVLLGVNGDEEKQVAIDTAEKAGINWPSIWANQQEKGLDDCPVLKAWNIRRWPTLYVIDHHGIIRAKDVHGKDLDAVVDQLVKEAAGK